MISPQTLSLKKSYKVLQKKMWEVSAQASELKKENALLKGKVNTKRMMMSANMNMRRRKCEKMQNKDQQWQQNKKTITQVNFERELRANKELKDEIQNLEKQKKEMEAQMQNIDNLQKENKKKFKQLQKSNKKYNYLLKCQDEVKQMLRNYEKTDFSYRNINCSKDQVLRSAQANRLIESESNYIQEISKITEELKEQQRKSKYLTQEMFKLLQKKNQIKQQFRFSKNSIK